MHYALVFSTSHPFRGATSPTAHQQAGASAAAWLDQFAADIAAFTPSGQPIWLDPGLAAEWTCTLSDQAPSSSLANPTFLRLRQQADKHQIDVNLVPLAGRRKRLLIADMDSTIITSESLDDLAAMAGIGDAVAAITRQSMAGEMDFEAALDARIAMLAGQSAQLFDRLVNDAVLTAGAAPLVQTMRAHGAKSYLVSGGFDFMTGPIAAQCGFDDHHANHMNEDDGKITGTVRKPVLDRDAKADYLAHYCSQWGLEPEDAATIGDGANDMAMLQAAGMGVAFNGKPLLRRAIALQLNHTDLRGLLYLQGYHADEFVTG